MYSYLRVDPPDQQSRRSNDLKYLKYHTLQPSRKIKLCQRERTRPATWIWGLETLPMPGRRRFTPEELASSSAPSWPGPSAAAGEPRLETDFDGDTDAYHAYQDQ